MTQISVMQSVLNGPNLVSCLQGNLLDDIELIGVLSATKTTGEEITEKLAIASDTRIKITEACEEYRIVAKRATDSYFMISSFASVNSMYQVPKNCFG